MNSTQLGQEAESIAVKYLKNNGYKIVDRNWKTRFCEIDIIATKNQRVYFIEVKFRSSSGAGSGVDYITNQKLRQMRFAAELWLSTNDWTGDCELFVIEVDPSLSVHIYSEID